MPEKDRLDTILDALKPKNGPSGFPLAKDTQRVCETLTLPPGTFIPLVIVAIVCMLIAAAREPDPIPVHKSGPDRPSVTTVAS